MAELCATSCSDEQVIDFVVHTLCFIELSPETLIMNIDSGDSGGVDPDVETATYDIINNFTPNAKIVAEIDQDMPGNTSLELNMGAPSGGGNSEGGKNLTTMRQVFVSNVARQTGSGSLTLTFSSQPTDVPASFSRVITYTITDDA